MAEGASPLLLGEFTEVWVSGKFPATIDNQTGARDVTGGVTSQEQGWFFDIGRDLLGTEFKLPLQFPADINVSVIAFKQWQQSQVDAWITALAASGIPESPFNTREMKSCILELPVLPGKFKLVRRFIDGGMAASIKNPIVLARTITIYGAVGDFRQSLGITSASDVSVRVVTRTGEVIWGTTGGANAVEVGAICDLVATNPR